MKDGVGLIGHKYIIFRYIYAFLSHGIRTGLTSSEDLVSS